MRKAPDFRRFFRFTKDFLELRGAKRTYSFRANLYERRDLLVKKGCLVLALLVALSTAASAAPAELTAVGQVVGIHLRERAVTVTGFTEDGAAAAAGLCEGDRIVAVNGQRVTEIAEIAPLLRGGAPVRIAVERGGKPAEFLVPPVACEGGWLLGIKVRDGISGIGTVTYYDCESGAYGALGHGVCAAGAREPLEMSEGELLRATVSGAEKGRRGAAGQLLGTYDAAQPIGTIEKNTEKGIFGYMPAGLTLGARYPVAAHGEVRTGEATILANVSGSTVEAYRAKILKIYPTQSQRNLLLEVTDPRLLQVTGGILQGMSGSVLLQDGKIIGAVTHVMVSDPTKGYGIFIENMLDAAG